MTSRSISKRKKGIFRPFDMKKWLKAIHIYCAAVWGGGAASLFAIHCLFTPESGPELYARNMTLIYVDNYIIAPSAIGCFVTGLIYAHLSKWGYLKFYWIAVKVLSNLVLLSAGLFWFIPWLATMAEASLSFRHIIQVDPTYAAAMDVHMIMAVGQTALVFFLMLISVIKPWGRTKLNF